MQLLKKSVLNELKRYFVTITYEIEARKVYAVASVLDPRFKKAVSQSRENSNLAKLMVLSEMQTALSTSASAKDPDSASSGNENAKAAPALCGIKCSTKVGHRRRRKTRRMPQGSSYRTI